ncbi:snRNA-activating protein complex subunit 4 [Orycteropus afer afer]|uniref:snRNA-activating protein complex subunit 4 n=1 Tax=Orycteropus afer afer TaxID=1230840 RepID=A0A8B7ACQ0_ORYAF|nr:snRNA-activating protein complex subunit 4 [Orycteropus afer afer]
MDADAEREKIAQEIRELELILDPGSSGVGVELSESSLDSDSDADSLCSEDAYLPGPLISEEERWGEASNEEEDPKERNLPEDPETCLQLNMVYQEVVREKIEETNLLLAQNRAQQEELSWDLAGSKGPKVKYRRNLPPHMYIGHFMKPYFKDKVTGVGPPANEDTREKVAQGIKSFKELLVTKWKSWEKTLLRKSVMSDRLQRLLQPKLLRLEYLQQKQNRVSSEMERQLLEKQLRDTEKEIEDIHQLPEEALLGNRLDSHDWEKISNVNFEGGRSAEEIQKFWQNSEHPSINKQEWSGEELRRLKSISAQHGHLQWQKIAEELGTRRSAFQCLQKFQQHNSDLKRKEWTQEEDCMLTQLVQEMRVGSHIPYRKMVYYMEGRDSVQLIYRWTKSLDPRLRRGCWAPEEDAKLLQAVAKHGEHDWFKIREEVPGRSDAQCRDRYIRRLHCSLKKGRWDPKEEEKLIELIGKYGAGHWAEIAAELPHRTGSQCLSKWKIMVRQKQQNRSWRRRRPQRCVRWSSSSEDRGGSSSSGEDTRGAREGEPAWAAPYVVPSMDLWVPTRQSTAELWKEGARGWLERPPASPSLPKEAEAGRRRREGASATALEPRADATQALGLHSSTQHPRSADTCSANSQELGDQRETPLREVPLETVLRVLRANTAAQGRELVRACTPPPSPPSLPQPRAHPRTRMHTHAPDGVWSQLQGVQLASTPVFTLLIQLFQIDTDGCMEVICERRAQPPTTLHHLQAPLSAQRCPGSLSSARPTREATRRSAGRKRSGGLGVRQRMPTLPPTPWPAPSGPRPKPKTVSELLQEKRLREARARRATSGPRTLPVQLLVAPPGVPHGPPAVCSLTLPGLSVSTGAGPGPAGFLQAPAPTPRGARNSAPKASRTPVPGPGQVPVLGQRGVQGLSQGPTMLPPFLPAAPSLVPAHMVAGTALPVTWVLTAQGLLPVSVPAVVGLPPAAGTPAPGLSMALLPSPVGTQANEYTQASPPRTAPTPQHSPAEAAGDSASGPGGLPSPQAAQRAPEAAAPPLPPEALSQAALLSCQPEAQRPWTGRLPSCSGPGGSAASPSGTGGPGALEKLPSPQPGSKKGTLDMCLLFPEGSEDTAAWLRGQRGVCVPPLGSRLPYQPPALCTLRGLFNLLLHKAALERKAAALVPGGTVGGDSGPPAEALQAVLGMVRTRLRDNSAYLLLKARFLAAFSLPAMLATLPPHGVLTTLSAATGLDPEGDSEELLGEPGSPDGVGHMASSPPAEPQASAPCCLDTQDDCGLRTRHSRKRRRLS